MWETNSWEKALLVFACPEKKDIDETKREALDIILDSLNNLKENKVLFVPFPHLSTEALSGDELQKSVSWLQKRFERRNYITTQLSFESAERLFFDIIGHKLAVAFRDVEGKNETISV